MEAPALTARAIAAAVAVARSFGVQVDQPRVLADLSNVIVALTPSLVARVATTTALVRGAAAIDHLTRDVALTAWLHARGAPVVPPPAELPAGPHEHDGLALSFAARVAHDPDGDKNPRCVAAALVSLHEALRDFGSDRSVVRDALMLPRLSPPLDDLTRALDWLEHHGGLERATLRWLRDVHASIAHALASVRADEQPLHGDAHAHNLLVTEHGLIWNDLEDACRGPIEWDLACLARRRPDALAVVPGARDRDLTPFLAARELQGAVWLTIAAARFPVHAPRAAAALAALRGTTAMR